MFDASTKPGQNEEAVEWEKEWEKEGLGFPAGMKEPEHVGLCKDWETVHRGL